MTTETKKKLLSHWCTDLKLTPLRRPRNPSRKFGRGESFGDTRGVDRARPIRGGRPWLTRGEIVVMHQTFTQAPIPHCACSATVSLFQRSLAPPARGSGARSDHAVFMTGEVPPVYGSSRVYREGKKKKVTPCGEECAEAHFQVASSVAATPRGISGRCCRVRARRATQVRLALI